MKMKVVVCLFLHALLISSNHGSYCTINSSENLNDINFQTCNEVFFDIEHLEVNRTISATSITGNIVLKGHQNHTKMFCSTGAGFKFDHINDLSILDVEVINCGTLHSYGFEQIEFRAAIFVLHSRNVTILNSSFSESDGSGLVLINNHMVQIEDSTFTGGISNTKAAILGGGGIFAALDCKSIPGNLTGYPKRYIYCDNSTLLIDGCHFIDNHVEEVPFISTFSSLRGTDNTMTGWRGGGGGVSFIIQDSSGNHVSIRDSMFRNNSAEYGGGLRVLFCHQARNNNISLQHSCFDHNKGHRGGGFLIEIVGLDVIRNSIEVNFLTLMNNEAHHGGGSMLYTYLWSMKKENVIKFSNCTWEGNRAHHGAAFYVQPPLRNVNIIPHLMFDTCSFKSNQIENDDSSSVEKIGEGIVMVTGYSLIFKGNTTFSHNRNGSCLHATSSTVHFESGTHTLFYDNTAINGAGMALYGYSSIIADDLAHVTFCNNSVMDKGAALYYFSTDIHSHSETCFIQRYNITSGKKIIYNFFGNKADHAYDDGEKTLNDSIYTTSLMSCQLQSNDSQYNVNNVGEFRYYNTCEICMILSPNLTNSTGNCSYEYDTPEISNGGDIEFNETVIHFVPGHKFKLTIQKSTALYRVLLRNNDGNIVLPMEYKIISEYLSLRGCPEDTGSVTLFEYGMHRHSMSFQVEARHCPPLYKMENKSCVCHSTEDINFVEFHKCDNIEHQASIRLGYWIGMVENDTSSKRMNECKENLYTMLTSYCPFGYCSLKTDNDGYIKLPDTNDKGRLDEAVCNSRQGTLCGQCKENTSVYFHSEWLKCDKNDLCYLGPLFYLLSEILPLTLLFLFIIFSNISFTSGNLNGFIFFAQVYDSITNVGASFIAKEDTYSKFSIIHRVVYKLFNFDFFNIENEFTFCLWKTPSTLNILVIKYLTGIYALVLILSTIWLLGFCSKFKSMKILRRQKYSTIHGISAFLVMTYSQLLKISFLILYPITIHRAIKGLGEYKDVVFVQGDIEYMSKEHLPYALPAIASISLAIILPLLLISYPLCNKVTAYFGIEGNCIIKFISKLIPIIKLKPFLDSFQGTFKDEFRFFAGLYFVYRAAILMSRLIDEAMNIYVIIQLLLMTILVLHTVTFPYQKKVHNIIDLFVFANLSIINILKLLNFSYAQNGKRSKDSAHVIHLMQLFFIYLPLVVLFFSCIHTLFWKLKISSRLKKMMGREERLVDSDYNDDELPMERGFSSESYRKVNERQLKIFS